MTPSITPSLLRVLHLLSFGEDVAKEDVRHAVRPATTEESSEVEGAKVAIDIFIKNNLAETHLYNDSAEGAVQSFIKEIVEEVPEMLADTKNYLKLLAEAASSAGLLPN